MPFPPNFDAAWDETFPPDTQAANLLGADIRNFKRDIRERVALMSGTLANRPAPDATWGGAGFGMLFFATDTNQIFQWNGAAWVDVTSSLVPGGRLSNSATTVVAPGGDGPILTIPANSLVVGSVIDVYADFTGAGQPRFDFGATLGIYIGLPGDTNWFSIRTKIIVAGAASQKISSWVDFHESLPSFGTLSLNTGVLAAAEAINAGINIKIHNTGGVNFTQNFMTVIWR